jgi:hypothetical protein
MGRFIPATWSFSKAAPASGPFFAPTCSKIRSESYSNSVESQHVGAFQKQEWLLLFRGLEKDCACSTYRFAVAVVY